MLNHDQAPAAPSAVRVMLHLIRSADGTKFWARFKAPCESAVSAPEMVSSFEAAITYAKSTSLRACGHSTPGSRCLPESGVLQAVRAPCPCASPLCVQLREHWIGAPPVDAALPGETAAAADQPRGPTPPPVPRLYCPGCAAEPVYVHARPIERGFRVWCCRCTWSGDVLPDVPAAAQALRTERAA